jgi:dihydropteroate synthase
LALDSAGTTKQIDAMIAPSAPAVAAAPRAGTPNVLARLLAHGRPVVMGILNVTPDSFSDGGTFLEPAAAISHARQMIADGADVIDIGAESTRPYGDAEPVSAAEEQRRLSAVLPVVAGMGCPVSIDTMKAAVAAWALDHGAAIVNDVWGLQRDPDMAPLVARRGVPVVIMHNRVAADPHIDIAADIEAFFEHSLTIAARAGIPRDAIVLDPGIGFGKTPDQSLAAIAQLGRFHRFGLPLLVGASRKRFINAVMPAPPDRRLGGSIAAHVLAVRNGARIIRAHDVVETVQAMRVMTAIGAHA